MNEKMRFSDANRAPANGHQLTCSTKNPARAGRFRLSRRSPICGRLDARMRRSICARHRDSRSSAHDLRRRATLQRAIG